MPEEEYIERVLSMDDGEPPPRRRMNTLVEHDPLQYDAAVDENTRPTQPPMAPPASAPSTARPAGGGAGDEFLDLELDLGDGRISSPDPIPPAAPVPARPAMFPGRVPAGPSARALPGAAAKTSPPTIPPPTVRAEDLDDLPIDAVLESIPPRAYSARPAALATASPPAARAQVPDSSKVRPSPSTMKSPPASKTYDSSPVIEVVSDDDDDEAGELDSAPERSAPAPRAPASGRPPAKTPAAGTPIVPAARQRPVPPPASEPPTRELRAYRTAESPLEKIVERIEAGDFGRALMLAEQTIAGGDESADLLHYAELCREKLRQTYLERIGSGRTILRVAVDPDTLRSRALDPRLAFLLSLLDGASTVDDVIDMSTMPPLEAVRALHELLQEGVVEIAPTGRRRQAP